MAIWFLKNVLMPLRFHFVTKIFPNECLFDSAFFFVNENNTFKMINKKKVEHIRMMYKYTNWTYVRSFAVEWYEWDWLDSAWALEENQCLNLMFGSHSIGVVSMFLVSQYVLPCCGEGQRMAKRHDLIWSLDHIQWVVSERENRISILAVWVNLIN